jgi:ribosomal protein S1
MKRVIGLAAVLALVCFTAMVFAADASAPTTPAAAASAAKAAVTKEAVKAASGETIVGTIKKIDTKANTILVRDRTITVKAEEIARLKKGDKVKVTLAPGTMNAEKTVLLSKKAAKERSEEGRGQGC